ncbi:MAG: hypothetical protein ABI878_14305 [Acidobacteriota bacterium]
MKNQRTGGDSPSFPISDEKTRRYVAWFHELDSWTEYWDVYHPESKGHYYFGDGEDAPGLLSQFLPRERMPPVFLAWKQKALLQKPEADFLREARSPSVAAALTEVDEFVGGVFAKHFGDASDPAVQEDYLEALFQFGIDNFPPATERYNLIADDDPRKSTAGRNALDGDIMWFAWSLQLEGAQANLDGDSGFARRSLQLAGVALGCPANFAWRAHRRTREEYSPDQATRDLLFLRARSWIKDFDATATEIGALYRIREWGSEE